MIYGYLTKVMMKVEFLNSSLLMPKMTSPASRTTPRMTA